MHIRDILKPGELEKLTQFDQKEIDWLDKRIATRSDGKPGVVCVLRGKKDDLFELTPEEIVRQLYAHRLIDVYDYPKKQMAFEVPVTYAGKQAINEKRIDIVLYADEYHKDIKLLIELKRPSIEDPDATYDEGATPLQQLQSYCKQMQPAIGVLANGGNLLNFYTAPRFDTELVADHFPNAKEPIEEWQKNSRFTLKQLQMNDRLRTESLKNIIQEVEQRFGANDSSDKAFDEIFKLIFTKLYDERLSSNDADEIAADLKAQQKYRGTQNLADVDDSGFRTLEFRARDGESPAATYERISHLFAEAKKEWPGVFQPDAVLNMQHATVRSCVRELQNVKLFNSNLEVVDDAFEHLVNQNQKEDMGQYFTPRYVIDMCVKMLHPRPDETMIDTAAGSCGFPMHTIFHVWQQLNPKAPNLFTTTKRTPAETAYVRNNVFGIDFSEKSVRVGRMLNIIAGDGHTNVLYLNTLDYRNWDDQFLHDKKWDARYHDGFTRLAALEYQGERDGKPRDDYRFFDFDILMANPPFAGDLDNAGQLAPYELSKNAKGKQQKKVGRDILFIERNLDFLKPGGRMAIVLPQGRFNNASDAYIRQYILKRCRLLGVIGLHGNVFKPHTGTKTSVLLVQKWTDKTCGYPDICPRPAKNDDGTLDYPVFFATMQLPSKDNSGDKIYIQETYVEWKAYTYETHNVYRRKSDQAEVTPAEYEQAANKRDYTVKAVTTVQTVNGMNDGGSPVHIKDVFIDQYGDPDDHRKWIQKNVAFVPKNQKAHPELPARLSVDAYVALANGEQKLYKETPILGINRNPQITQAAYDALPAAAKKYYLPSEIVREWTDRVRDTHGHIVVEHDLFNPDPHAPNPNPHHIYFQNGIAEAFAKFAYDQHLSFAPTEKELHAILHPENEPPF
ncbi:MAG: N-6 DNA methylase [Selenomonas sp.]|uniref:restriction endonuclease subunit M n=1 Tax=Selenomonas sp. TaxID=2053611 RepID=UPI0025DF55B7|nr:N-6 DNA methylase [Selenomonas sp.]MCI6086545.1 N-6 DNA methylase [Selenomonas sp.]